MHKYAAVCKHDEYTKFIGQLKKFLPVTYELKCVAGYMQQYQYDCEGSLHACLL